MPTTFEEVMDFHPDNRYVYEEIRESLDQLLPFVGAGLTASVYGAYGYVLRSLGEKLTDQHSVQHLDRLLSENDYAGAAQFLEESRGKINLAHDLEHYFSRKKLEDHWDDVKKGAIWLLPDLFECPVLTTNYDEAIETVYANHNATKFPVIDVSSPNLRSLSYRLRYAPCVLKLRGTVAGTLTDYSKLVFTKTQYEMCYSSNSETREVLRRFIDGRSLFFLGCSPLQVVSDFLRSITEFGSMHFAVVGCKPKDRDNSIRTMANGNTRTIVYEDDRHESVRVILEQLAKEEKRSERSAPAPLESVISTDSSGNEPDLDCDLKQVIAHINSHLVMQREYHPSFRSMGNDPSKDLLPSGLTGANSVIDNAQRHIRTEDDEIISLQLFFKRSWRSIKQNHLFIFGQGGIGKTVALLTLATEPGFLPKDVPTIYIPLYDLVQYLDAGHDCIDRYLERSFSNVEYKAIQKLSKEPWEDGPKVILLLDGHNEIPPDRTRDVNLGIRAWAMRAGTQLVITSRTAGPFVTENTVWLQLLELSRNNVRDYLHSHGIMEPEPDSRLWQVLETPLMLAAYADIKTLGAVVYYEHLPIEPTDNLGHVIWDYLLRELWICVQRPNSSHAKADYVAALLLTLPYVCWRMETDKEAAVSQQKLYAYVCDACRQWYGDCLPHSIEAIERALSIHLAGFDTKSPPESQLQILTTETGLLYRNGDTYSLIHKSLLEGFAAIHLKNAMETPCEKLPIEFTHNISEHVMDFLVDVCEIDSLFKLWEMNRKEMPTKNVATFNLLRAIHAKNEGDLSALDWSNMDIRGINLFPLRNGIALKLSKNPNQFQNTVLGIGCFSWRQHAGVVSTINFSPHSVSPLLAIGSSDGTVHLWDCNLMLRTGPSFAGHQTIVRSVCFSPDGRLLASGSDDGTVRLWDTATGAQALAPLEGHRGLVLSGCFSPDGRLLASTSTDGTVRLWDTATGAQALAPLEGRGGVVRSVCFSPDGRLLASGSDDGSVRLWDSATGRQVGSLLEGHGGTVRSVCFSPDGQLLAGNTDDGSVILWDDVMGMRTGKSLIEGRGKSVTVCFSPDGALLASGLNDGTVRLWDYATGRQVGSPLEGHGGTVRSVCFSPDGRLLASGSDDGTVRLWDTATGAPALAPLEGHGGVVRSVCFSPDGRLLASGSDDGCLRIWDAMSRTQSVVIEASSGHISSVCFSPDGRLVTCGSIDGAVRVWDVATHRLVVSVDGHRNRVRSVCFSPDGTVLASGSDDGTVRLWSPVTQSQIGTLDVGRHGLVTSIRFSPDGRRLAIGSDDGTVRLWDPTSGKLPFCKQISNSGHRINSICFSPDGSIVAIGSADGFIRVINGSTPPMTIEPLPGINITGLDFSMAIIEKPHDSMVLRQNGAIV